MILPAGMIIYSTDSSLEGIEDAKDHAKRCGLTPKDARLVRIGETVNLELLVPWEKKPLS